MRQLSRFRSFAGVALAAAAMSLAPATARAQGTTADKINRAIELYGRLEIEAARPLLLEVLSTSWLQPVSTEQRVTAYKYLGASYAVIGKIDTAANYFVGALAYDAFTDLDPNEFNTAELNAFAVAKSQIFKVGMRPLRARVINPKSDTTARNSLPIRITNTQLADVTVTIGKIGGPADSIFTVYRGTNNGTRDLVWRGDINGKLATPGNYELKITGKSSSRGETVTDKQEFTVEQRFVTLEDPLPPFAATDTLVASYNPRDPIFDLVRGASLGIVTATIAKFAIDKNKLDPNGVSKWNAQWVIAAGVGAGAGLGAFSYRRQHLLKTDAVRENANRFRKWNEFNDGVARRNADRLDKTLLIITPR